MCIRDSSVREALDWLVKNEVVLYQGDKYQINKREFIEMSKRKAMEEKEMNENISLQPEKTGINENKTEIRDTSTESTITAVSYTHLLDPHKNSEQNKIKNNRPIYIRRVKLTSTKE